jgi:GTPase SAR1 family protein
MNTEARSGKPIAKKVCILGATGVGKTSLVRRWVHGIFDEGYKTTIGVNIQEMNVTVDGNLVSLMIWDLEGYDDPLKQYDQWKGFVEGSNAYVLVMDGSRPLTLWRASTIQQLVHAQLNLQPSARIELDQVPFIAIVNKCDLGKANDFHVDGWMVYETSAKTGQNVIEAFHNLVRVMLQADRERMERGGETLRLEGDAGFAEDRNYEF